LPTSDSSDNLHHPSAVSHLALAGSASRGSVGFGERKREIEKLEREIETLERGQLKRNK
ncbi:hypothetical protein Dimus_031446, partial [Dionaea muscipula]